jgi:type IV pilus assembly protein PilP
MRRVVLVTLLMSGARLMAASPDTQPAAPQGAASPAAAVPGAPAAAAYRYNPEGRRDPFLSLVGGGDSKTQAKPTGEGLAGIRVDDVAVRGILQTHERFVAMVQGPDSRSYVVHQGDRLADGVVKSVAPEGLVLVQDISDPRSKERTREVRKPLRTPAEEKE